MIYGNGAQPRKVVHHDYDIASRLTSLTVNGAAHASQIVYNAASQTTSLKVGLSGANQITENYGYNSQTGLLDNQTVARGATTLLNLSYDYANASGKRTGQLTKILNNLNHHKDRGYGYDRLGRLTQATGGPSTAPLWTQSYSYDRYGNRTTVSGSGNSAMNQSGKGTELAKAGSAGPGSAGILPAIGKSEPGVVATGSSAAIAQPADPQVAIPTEQLATRTDVKLPDSLRTDATRSTANSHHASRSALPNTPTPQGSPPVFTDPDLLAPGGIHIKALHITQLRTAIDDLRIRRGGVAYSWQTSLAGFIKVDPIDEMRTVLNLLLGPPPPPGYSEGLAQNYPILAVHIQELRNRVVANWNSSSSIPADGHANLSYEPATNRINSAGFAYDAAGNQVKALIAGGPSQWFQYDAANRLVKVTRNNNQTVIATYTYGNSNERLVAQEGNQRTYYACGGKAEYVESGGSTTPQWSKTYIHLGARLLSTLTPNGSGGAFIQYHHPDRLGTRLVTNAQDTNYFEQQTLPFGTALNESPPTGGTSGETNRRFTTYDRNLNTGLDYAINRHYDPQQGRFTQVDPIGMSSVSLESPQSLNLYAYCVNDPINHTDPSGLGFLSKIFKAIGKAIKIIAIALVVVVVVALVIYAAPAGAALISFAEVLLFKAAPVLAKVLAGLTGFHTGNSTLGPGGTPTWNPNAGNSRTVFGRSFQGQDPLNPGDVPGLTGPCPGVGSCTVVVGGSAVLRRIYRDVRALANLTAGAIDQGILFGRYYRWGIERALGGPAADENSTSYSVGWWGAFAGETVIGVFTGATEVKASGWAIRAFPYPNAGGGGINLSRLGVRRFALDWHRIKSVGPRNVLHWHWGATKKAMKIHRGFWTGRAL